MALKAAGVISPRSSRPVASTRDAGLNKLPTTSLCTVVLLSVRVRYSNCLTDHRLTADSTPALRFSRMSVVMSLAVAVRQIVRPGYRIALEGFTHLVLYAAGH